MGRRRRGAPPVRGAPVAALKHLVGLVRRSLAEFLGLPLLVVIGFVVLAVGIYRIDDAVWSGPSHPKSLDWLPRLFGDTGALSSLLSTVASSIITVTSITFSLLLLAVQQGASALNSQVFDQFLRRKANQFPFGFFVGLSVFVLATLVTASPLHRPIFGALTALLLTAAALCMIVVLIYNTIDLMRPTSIIGAIHRHVLRSRATQVALLSSVSARAAFRRSGSASRSSSPTCCRASHPRSSRA